MKSIFKNWKTTLAGIVTGACAVVPLIAPQHTVTAGLVLKLAVSVGLIASKDVNKTGV